MTAAPSKTLLRYLLAVLVVLLFALPLLAMATTSLRDPARAAMGFALLPDSLHWQNHFTVWRATNFPCQFVNSLLLALGVMAGQIITSLLAGDAFAPRFLPANLPGKKLRQTV